MLLQEQIYEGTRKEVGAQGSGMLPDQYGGDAKRAGQGTRQSPGEHVTALSTKATSRLQKKSNPWRITIKCQEIV